MKSKITELPENQTQMTIFVFLYIFLLIVTLERRSSGPSRDQEGTGGEGHLGNGLAPNNKSKSTSQLSAGTLQSETSNLTKVWWNDS